MRISALTLVLLLQAAAALPALATSCDTRCDAGEVWTEKDGGTCVPADPKTS